MTIGVTPSIPLTHPNTPNSPNTKSSSRKPRNKRNKPLHMKRASDLHHQPPYSKFATAIASGSAQKLLIEAGQGDRS
eukprot:1147688-Pelagomonas_calceolata.AAC.2